MNGIGAAALRTGGLDQLIPGRAIIAGDGLEVEPRIVTRDPIVLVAAADRVVSGAANQQVCAASSVDDVVTATRFIENRPHDARSAERAVGLVFRNR